LEQEVQCSVESPAVKKRLSVCCCYSDVWSVSVRETVIVVVTIRKLSINPILNSKPLRESPLLVTILLQIGNLSTHIWTFIAEKKDSGKKSMTTLTSNICSLNGEVSNDYIL
jgi:hypothetical protein